MLTMLLIYEQKYPPSATTLHFEFYAEPGPEVKIERKVKMKKNVFMQKWVQISDVVLMVNHHLKLFWSPIPADK